MKNTLSEIICILLMLSFLAGCAASGQPAATGEYSPTALTQAKMKLEQEELKEALRKRESSDTASGVLYASEPFLPPCITPDGNVEYLEGTWYCVIHNGEKLVRILYIEKDPHTGEIKTGASTHEIDSLNAILRERQDGQLTFLKLPAEVQNPIYEPSYVLHVLKADGTPYAYFEAVGVYHRELAIDDDTLAAAIEAADITPQLDLSAPWCSVADLYGV